MTAQYKSAKQQALKDMRAENKSFNQSLDRLYRHKQVKNPVIMYLPNSINY